MPAIDRLGLLTEAYRNNAGSHIAFVDESYLTPGFAVDTTIPPFYVMTAYVIPVTELDIMREDIVELSGRRFWHSTEAYRSEDGREKLRSFTRYIGDGSEPLIVSVQLDVSASDFEADRSREACFRRLLQALAMGEHCDPISLVVFEERKHQSDRNFDARIISRARSEGLIPRTIRVMPMSPAVEPLLWLADVVSFAVNHELSARERSFLKPFAERLITITP